MNFILAKDKNDLFRFAALQSEAGQILLLNHGLENTDFDTFILINDANYFTKSTAALMIAGKLKSVVRLFYPFIFLPKPIRDFFYDLIAKSRYKFFGKRDVCRVPSDDERKKFIF